jgi:hypothetical protein
MTLVHEVGVNLIATGVAAGIVYAAKATSPRIRVFVAKVRNYLKSS